MTLQQGQVASSVCLEPLMRINLLSIFDQLPAELAPATIIHNEYPTVMMNNFGD
jgi:hypothetical protein